MKTQIAIVGRKNDSLIEGVDHYEPLTGNQFLDAVAIASQNTNKIIVSVDDGVNLYNENRLQMYDKTNLRVDACFISFENNDLTTTMKNLIYLQGKIIREETDIIVLTYKHDIPFKQAKERALANAELITSWKQQTEQLIKHEFGCILQIQRDVEQTYCSLPEQYRFDETLIQNL